MNTITEMNTHAISVELLCDAVNIPRATYYRHVNKKEKPIRSIPVHNKLDESEKKAVLDILHSDEHADKTPYEIFYTLMDEGKYYCSPRTMYRFLAEKQENKERRIFRNHRDAVKPELMSVKPNEVWSWDISKLLGPRKFIYYHLYVIMDIYSRYVVGWMIAERESKTLARQFIQRTALKHGIQPGELTLHADNGPSMTSITVSQLLDHLG